MGRGGAIYLSYTALVLLSAISPASAGLWDVSIDLDPAPSPEDGPPFSAHATRNRALLPYQIIGVVASYLGTVLIVGTLLLTVGRRLRKKAQAIADRPTEMIRPLAGHFGQSPSSFHNTNMWDSLRSKKSTASSLRSRSEVGSPGGNSLKNFDETVLQRDKERANEEMARMYEALYEQEEEKATPTVSAAEVQRTNPPPMLSIPRPGRLDLQRVQTAESAPYSPTTPKSPYHAIYPPDYPSATAKPGPPEIPRSPVMTQSPERTGPTPFGSNRAVDFATGGQAQSKQSLRKSIRHLKISAPIQRLREDNDDGARTPLSPRFYTNPGVPPEPPSATTLDGQGYPVTPGSTVTADFIGAYGAEVEAIDHVRDVPQAYPQRVNNPSQPYPDSPERRRGGNATNTNAALPFRQKQYLQAQNFPLSPGRWQPLSAGPVKTTFVDAPRHLKGGPLTGVPTPYSPYMPGGLVTPVTPRIMSRDERKQKRKEDRAIRGAITEEDQVADDKDLWSSGY